MVPSHLSTAALTCSVALLQPAVLSLPACLESCTGIVLGYLIVPRGLKDICHRQMEGVLSVSKPYTGSRAVLAPGEGSR